MARAKNCQCANCGAPENIESSNPGVSAKQSPICPWFTIFARKAREVAAFFLRAHLCGGNYQVFFPAIRATFSATLSKQFAWTTLPAETDWDIVRALQTSTLHAAPHDRVNLVGS